MLFNAHWHAFRVFGGAPGRGIYDNMKTAVDRVGKGKQRDINARFKAMASHYVFEPEFCNPAAGWGQFQRAFGVRQSVGEPDDGGYVPRDALVDAMTLAAAGLGEFRPSRAINESLGPPINGLSHGK